MTDFCCEIIKHKVNSGKLSIDYIKFPLLGQLEDIYKCMYCYKLIARHEFDSIKKVSEDIKTMKDYIEVEIIETQKWPSLAACDRILSMMEKTDTGLQLSNERLIMEIIVAYKRLVKTTASHVANSIKNAG